MLFFLSIICLTYTHGMVVVWKKEWNKNYMYLCSTTQPTYSSRNKNKNYIDFLGADDLWKMKKKNPRNKFIYKFLWNHEYKGWKHIKIIIFLFFSSVLFPYCVMFHINSQKIISVMFFIYFFKNNKTKYIKSRTTFSLLLLLFFVPTPNWWMNFYSCCFMTLFG